MGQNRETFAGKFSAVFALAGSAIGLGNIWRFPYIVGENGGAAFIILYIIFSALFALPIFFAESLIGRSTQSSTFGAFNKLAPESRWKILCYFSVITPMIIVCYYSVVGGWSVGYLYYSVIQSFGEMTKAEVSSLFTHFTGSVWTPVICHTVFILLTALVVRGGVRKGIEKMSNLAMPALFSTMVLLMAFSLLAPGAGKGVSYLIKPDFSKISGPAIAAAMGQSFFSLSLGVGTILTYSSYMKKQENIIESGFLTAVFDLMFALIASFVIMPAAFSAGIEPSAGPGLVFESLPYVFSQVGATSPMLSKIVTIAFFFAILVAALTSEVSMFEVCTAYLVEERRLSRKKATVLVFVIGWLGGILCVIFPRLFDIMDFTSSNILMTLGALGFCLFVGWKMKKTVVESELTNNGSIRFNQRIFKTLYFVLRYVAPIGIALIFISNFISW
ncbi:MAG: sodium-dependent transporter [Bacteroidales bacterium]|nr:sodium-dependent transporter [Bacteroidales bacterium]